MNEFSDVGSESSPAKNSQRSTPRNPKSGAVQRKPNSSSGVNPYMQSVRFVPPHHKVTYNRTSISAGGRVNTSERHHQRMAEENPSRQEEDNQEVVRVPKREILTLDDDNEEDDDAWNNRHHETCIDGHDGGEEVTQQQKLAPIKKNQSMFQKKEEVFLLLQQQRHHGQHQLATPRKKKPMLLMEPPSTSSPAQKKAAPTHVSIIRSPRGGGGNEVMLSKTTSPRQHFEAHEKQEEKVEHEEEFQEPIPADVVSKLEQALAEKAILVESLTIEKSSRMKLNTKLQAAINDNGKLKKEVEKFQYRISLLVERKKQAAQNSDQAKELESLRCEKDVEFEAEQVQYRYLERKLKELESQCGSVKSNLMAELDKRRTKDEQKGIANLEKKCAALAKEVSSLQMQLHAIESGAQLLNQNPKALKLEQAREASKALQTIEEEVNAKRKVEMHRIQEEAATRGRELNRLSEEQELKEKNARQQITSQFSNIELTKQAKSHEASQLRGKIQKLQTDIQNFEKDEIVKKEKVSSQVNTIQLLERSLKAKEGKLHNELQKKIDLALTSRSPEEVLKLHQNAWSKEKTGLEQNNTRLSNRVEELRKTQKDLEKKIEEKKAKEKKEEQEEKEATQKLEKQIGELKKKLKNKKEEELKSVETEMKEAQMYAEGSQKKDIILTQEKKLEEKKKEISAVQDSNSQLENKLRKAKDLLAKNNIALN